MQVFEKLGGAAIIAGSLLLSAYSVLFPILLPLGTGTFDYAEVVRSPGWVPLAVVAFAGALVYALGPAISVFVSIAGIFTFAVGCMLLGVRLLR